MAASRGNARIGPLSRLRETAPGIVLVCVLAGAAKLLADLTSAWTAEIASVAVSPVLLAVLIGLLWRNSAGVPAWCQEGMRWTAQAMLRFGIALLGLRLTLVGVGQIFTSALPVVIACIAVALIVGAAVARALGISARLGRLLAVGTAVCGCSAVVALSPVVRARDVETGFALACVVLFGSLGMLCYPWLAGLLFESSPVHAGIFLGTAIHDTSQVVGAALIYSEQAGAPEALSAAAATKLLRNLSMVVLIPLAAWQFRDEGSASQAANEVWRHAVPMFVVGFLAFVVVRTLGDQFFATSDAVATWTTIVAGGQFGSELLLIGAMTAVGLSVSFSDLRGVGWRPLLGGLATAATVAACSITLSLVSMRL